MSKVICQSNKDLPQEMILGNILYYSLSDMTIAESDLLNIFLRHNIPETYVRKISKADAFRRASSSEKGTVSLPDPTNTYGFIKAKVEIDEVRSDNDKIVRIIGRKLINENLEEVDYQSVAEVSFDRKSETMSYTITTTDPDEANIFDTVCRNIDQKYGIWSVYHSKDTIRNIVNRIINDTHPVNLMPTGLCKFVPSMHSDLLYDLKEALKDLEGYGSVVAQNGQSQVQNFMEVIPVIDTEEQRDLIQKASTNEIQTELFEFTQELKEILVSKTTLSSRTAASYIAKFNVLKEKVKDYETLLGNYLGFLTSQITSSVKLVNDNLEDDDVGDV
jgi:hypothetical protein